jgi:hypothetical protein
MWKSPLKQRVTSDSNGVGAGPRVKLEAILLFKKGLGIGTGG